MLWGAPSPWLLWGQRRNTEQGFPGCLGQFQQYHYSQHYPQPRPNPAYYLLVLSDHPKTGPETLVTLPLRIGVAGGSKD